MELIECMWNDADTSNDDESLTSVDKNLYPLEIDLYAHDTNQASNVQRLERTELCESSENNMIHQKVRTRRRIEISRKGKNSGEKADGSWEDGFGFNENQVKNIPIFWFPPTSIPTLN
ncbi:hypothetical protein RF11_03234 [Thelohanellus kitauei]|uniref:Uncharacterized protein n=1 Tax=Thelohanellus kitauei TaxID=669202 RepID=A0A0C2IFV0_THEKT|nr:hypothetical protein RF11_03234 [Thelohanellus kitauei]